MTITNSSTTDALTVDSLNDVAQYSLGFNAGRSLAEQHGEQAYEQLDFIDKDTDYGKGIVDGIEEELNYL